MLGTRIADPDHVESEQDVTEGLGLLRLTTTFQRDKRTLQVRARKQRDNWLTEGLAVEDELPGYFIHAGLTEGESPLFHASRVARRVSGIGSSCFTARQNGVSSR